MSAVMQVPAGITELRSRFEAAHPSEVLRWTIERFPRDRRVVVTSLQAEGTAIIDMVLALDHGTRIVTIDTGRLPEETLAYADALRHRFAHDIEVVMPDSHDVEPFVSQFGPNAFYSSVELRLRCCELRKVRPLARVLAGVDCWITGLRRTHSSGRGGTRILEIDEDHGGIFKVNPLVAWSPVQVRAYLAQRDVPLHPLYARGYTSIGCAPCTRPVEAGAHERAGRWWWEQGVAAECGMHGRPADGSEAE